ncbi:MAG: hypothetical protein WCX61_04445 [Candidatus Peribacteraceae bacterium]|jgi:predicted transporter
MWNTRTKYAICVLLAVLSVSSVLVAAMMDLSAAVVGVVLGIAWLALAVTLATVNVTEVLKRRTPEERNPSTGKFSQQLESMLLFCSSRPVLWSALLLTTVFLGVQSEETTAKIAGMATVLFIALTVLVGVIHAEPPMKNPPQEEEFGLPEDSVQPE